jgi:hypothetical protein
MGARFVHLGHDIVHIEFCRFPARREILEGSNKEKSNYYEAGIEPVWLPSSTFDVLRQIFKVDCMTGFW